MATPASLKPGQVVSGFDLDFWQTAGFKINQILDPDGERRFSCGANFGNIRLYLNISDAIAGGSVDRKNGDSERHAVSQSRAIWWFGRVCPEFRALVIGTRFEEFLERRLDE